MFRITSNPLAQALQLLRSALQRGPRRVDPLVTFLPSRAGLQLRCQTTSLALQLSLPGEASGAPLTVPASSLGQLPRTRQLPLELMPCDGGAVVRWQDRGIPQERTIPCAEPSEWPVPPGAESANSVELLEALEAAAGTTDPQSLRFTLGCIRWRGTTGQLAATDGRQALLWAGFHFPWLGDVLARASPVFGKLRSQTRGPVHVGRNDDWLSLRSPEWQVWLKIEREGRFPDVEGQIPSADQADSTLAVTETDARYLELALPKLPGAEDKYAPVTLELNGSVAVRAQAESLSATELVLTDSRREGAEVRCCTNRGYLHRALSLGFRQVFLRGPEAPAFCRDHQRAYIWALLSPQDCIPHERCGTQILSSQRTA